MPVGDAFPHPPPRSATENENGVYVYNALKLRASRKQNTLHFCFLNNAITSQHRMQQKRKLTDKMGSMYKWPSRDKCYNSFVRLPKCRLIILHVFKCRSRMQIIADEGNNLKCHRKTDRISCMQTPVRRTNSRVSSFELGLRFYAHQLIN